MAQKTDTAEHFSRQAEAYANSHGHAAGGDLDIVAAYAGAGLQDLCLDIATGPGHTAFRLASKASLVVGIDIAGGMLAKAREMARDRELHNLVFQHGDAAAIPFRESIFDIVTCRIAPHHFRDIPAFLAEVKRVLRPGGRFILEDSMAPEQFEAKEFLHWLEVTRDPTHVRSLTRQEWLEAIAASGLLLRRECVYQKQHPFADWLKRTDTPAETVEEISKRILTASDDLRRELFAVDGDEVTLLKDHKLILRADKPIGVGS